MEISTDENAPIEKDEDTQIMQEQDANNQSTADIETGTTTDEINVEDLTYYPNLRRSKRPSKHPERYAKLMTTYSLMSSDIPQSYDEAINSKESEKWKHDISEQINSINKKDTWDFVSCPDGVKKSVQNGCLI